MTCLPEAACCLVQSTTTTPPACHHRVSARAVTLTDRGMNTLELLS